MPFVPRSPSAAACLRPRRSSPAWGNLSLIAGPLRNIFPRDTLEDTPARELCAVAFAQPPSAFRAAFHRVVECFAIADGPRPKSVRRAPVN